MVLSFLSFITEQAGSEIGAAWHGSPHSFDKFSRKETAHTGEGGAAYGSGVYVSSHRKVGEYYRDIDKKKKGTLYHIHIKSDPKKMMHWDKPVSEQPEHVKKVLKSTDYDFSKNEDPPARHVFHHIRQSYAAAGHSRQESSELASKHLEDHGLHGITYEGDTKVKLAREKPTNHVIFDPKHIHIKEKI
jgi:hypothetical protein